MTPQEAELMLTKARAQLLLSQPFFATLLLRMQFEATDKTPIMATDGVKLYYNPEGIATLSMDECKGVLCHECFPPETLIITKQGLQQIGCIREGDYVYTRWGTFGKVTHTFRRHYEGDVINIKPAFGLPVQATPDHPILCLELPKPIRPQIGMPKALAKQKPKRLVRGIKYIPAKDLDPSRHLLLFPLPYYQDSKKRAMTLMWTRRHYTRKKVVLDKDVAYFLGWFVGDGGTAVPCGCGATWFKPSTTKRIITLTLANHDPHERLMGIINEKFYRNCQLVDLAPKKAKRICFSSLGLSRYLHKHFYDKDGNKTVPSWMLAMPKAIVESFVAGLLESDGYSHGDRNEIGNTSLGVVGILPLLLIRAGYSPQVRLERPTKGNYRAFYKVGWQTCRRLNSAGVRRGKYWVVGIRKVAAEHYEGDVCNLETTSHDYVLPFFTVHNCMHPALQHHTRRGDRDPNGWNVAADYAVNPMVKGSGLALPAGHLDNPAYHDKTADEIYKLMPKQPKGGGGGKGKGGGASPPGGQQGQPQPGKGPADFGQVWDAPADQKDTQEHEWRMAVSQAIQAARSCGQLPAGIDQLVEITKGPRAPWFDRLKRFIAATVVSDYTWSRPSRRTASLGIYLPSVTKEGTGHIDVAIDCSGSISDRELQEFGSKFDALHEELKPELIRAIYFDAIVQNVKEFGPEDQVTFDVKGRGGTDVRSAFDWIEKSGKYPKCLVVLTDLETPFPEPPSYPVLWVSVNQHAVPFGDVAFMEVQ